MAGKWWGTVSKGEVEQLATAILDPSRQRPIVVLTTPGFSDTSRVPAETMAEAEELRDAVGDVADIAIIITGATSFLLDELLPDRWNVYNGFGRSYPAGILADPDIHRSPLRRRRPGEVVAEPLISDVLRHAYAAGLLQAATATTGAVTATVKGFLGGGEQCLVDVGKVMPVAMWRDTVSPGVPLEWVVAKGSRLVGSLDHDHNRFVPNKLTFGPKEFEDAFPHGAVTLALVDEVQSDRAVLRVHPDLPITIYQRDVSSNPLDDLDLFLVQGEVVRVRAVHLSTGQPHLRMSDLDDDESVVPAVPVIEGGTPWLEEGRSLPRTEPEPAAILDTGDLTAITEQLREAAATSPVTPEPVAPESLAPIPVPTPATVAQGRVMPSGPAAGGGAAVQAMSMTITKLKAEIDQLRQRGTGIDALRHANEVLKLELRALRLELSDTREEAERFRNLHAKAVAQLRHARNGSAEPAPLGGPRDRRRHWPTDEEWIRDEIRRAWVERVPRVDKDRYALPEQYDLGPGFVASLELLDDGQFEKAMKCAVDVLTDRAKDMAGRDLHRLRVGDGGGDAPRIRAEDGAVAWRAAIEINVASARRLHYWAVGNRIELARVGVHDDIQM